MTIVNVDAARAWDGADGAHWTVHEEHYNNSMRPHSRHIFAAAGLRGDEDVLDVGCGCGETTRYAARSARTALGVDLSSQMLARAAQRAVEEGLTNVTFRQADAQVEPFEPVDVVISRAGVMFFSDPLAAFTNLHTATRPGGRLCVLVWRELQRNPWVATLREALAAGRELPIPPSGAPWPMGLADQRFVRPLLADAGYRSIEFIEVDEPLTWGADTEQAFAFVSTTAVARGLLEDLDADTRAAALDTLRTRIAHFDGRDGVVVPSSAWVITARA